MDQRNARFTAIEQSAEMAAKYEGPPSLVVADAIAYEFEPFDFAVSFLTFMFLPIGQRVVFLRRLISLTKPGGSLRHLGECGESLRCTMCRVELGSVME